MFNTHLGALLTARRQCAKSTIRHPTDKWLMECLIDFGPCISSTPLTSNCYTWKICLPVAISRITTLWQLSLVNLIQRRMFRSIMYSAVRLWRRVPPCQCNYNLTFHNWPDSFPSVDHDGDDHEVGDHGDRDYGENFMRSVQGPVQLRPSPTSLQACNFVR